MEPVLPEQCMSMHCIQSLPAQKAMSCTHQRQIPDGARTGQRTLKVGWKQVPQVASEQVQELDEVKTSICVNEHHLSCMLVQISTCSMLRPFHSSKPTAFAGCIMATLSGRQKSSCGIFLFHF
jgi:hypothetical protein